MSIVAVKSNSKPADGAPPRPGFWHRLARRLDALVAYPANHAVSERELRRVDDDIRRCRQLMFGKPQACRDAMLGRLPMRHAVRAIKAR